MECLKCFKLVYISGSGQIVAAGLISCSLAFLMSIVTELSKAPLETSRTVVTPQNITCSVLPKTVKLLAIRVGNGVELR